MRLRAPLSAALIALVMTFPQNTLAQSDLFVEEILVTARKQTESLQDVPLSLTAIGAVEIDQLGIETTEDVIKLSPGLTYSKGIGNADVRPDIRGITPLSGRSNIAILVDGVDITTDALVGTGAGQLISTGLFDIERIEVVRGPQSALFGRNAFGGAINYITKKPSTDFEGTFNGEVASFGTFKGKFGITGPINDKLLYRLNLARSHTDGQYDTPVIGNLEEEDSTSASLALQFLPNDAIELIVRLDWGKQERTHAAVATAPVNGCFTRDSGKASFSRDLFPDLNGDGNYTNDSDNSNFCNRSLANQRVDVVGDPLYTLAPNDRDPSIPDVSLQFLGEVPSLDDSDITLSDDKFLGTRNRVAQITTLLSWELDENGDYILTWNNNITRAEGIDDYDLDYQENTNTLNGFTSSIAFPWATDPSNSFNYHTHFDFEREVIFEDFRLSYDAGDDVRWLVGMEYYKEVYDNKNYSRANGAVEDDSREYTVQDGIPAFCFNPGNIPFADCTFFVERTLQSALPYNQNRDSKSFGIYGSYDWVFEENWEISVSARYQEDKFSAFQDVVDRQTVVPQFEVDKPVFTRASDVLFEADEETYTTFNPRIVLSHYLNDEMMIYGSVAKGTKPGGYSFQYELSDENQVYDQEKIISYEFGWKTSWMDDRVIVNGALFEMKNTDKQANNRETVGSTPFGYVDNIGEAKIRGLELSVAAVISSSLSTNISYAFIDTEVTDYVSLQGKGLTSDVTTPEQAEASGDPDYDFSGKQLPRTPKHNLLVTLQYDWLWADEIDGFARLDTKFLSKRYTDVDNLIELPRKTTLDLQVGAKTGEWEAIGFIDNLLNDDRPTSSVGFINFTNSFYTNLIVYPADKRTAGVRVKYYF